MTPENKRKCLLTIHWILLEMTILTVSTMYLSFSVFYYWNRMDISCCHRSQDCLFVEFDYCEVTKISIKHAWIHGEDFQYIPSAWKCIRDSCIQHLYDNRVVFEILYWTNTAQCFVKSQSCERWFYIKTVTFLLAPRHQKKKTIEIIKKELKEKKTFVIKNYVVDTAVLQCKR